MIVARIRTLELHNIHTFFFSCVGLKSETFIITDSGTFPRN